MTLFVSLLFQPPCCSPWSPVSSQKPAPQSNRLGLQNKPGRAALLRLNASRKPVEKLHYLVSSRAITSKNKGNFYLLHPLWKSHRLKNKPKISESQIQLIELWFLFLLLFELFGFFYLSLPPPSSWRCLMKVQKGILSPFRKGRPLLPGSHGITF